MLSLYSVGGGGKVIPRLKCMPGVHGSWHGCIPGVHVVPLLEASQHTSMSDRMHVRAPAASGLWSEHCTCAEAALHRTKAAY